MVYATHTSNLVVMLLPLRNIAVIAMSLLVVDAVILTRTLTRTLKTTLTVKEFTHTFCASFVNATTACRRRRQALVEMPILIAFDPVDAIDTNLRGLPTILDPTSVLPLEETRRPELFQRVQTHLLQSSQSSPSDYERIAAPLQFGQFLSYFNSLWTVKAFTSVTVTQLINYVKTVTETNTTKTFIVKNCIPPNFSFKRCSSATDD